MSKSTFKGSLLATTVIAGMALATPAMAQNQTVPETAPPAPVTPTNTQGTTPPAAPSDQTPPAGVQTNESAAPAEPTSSQEIVITGTLIRNPNLVASAPVTVLGHDEVQLRQTNTAEDILRTIPGAAPSIGAQVNNRASARRSTTATAVRPMRTFAAWARTVTSSCSTAFVSFRSTFPAAST